MGRSRRQATAVILEESHRERRLRVDREGQRGRLVPSGSFDLAHAATVASAVENLPPDLEGCRSIDVELASLDRIDGAGAVLLAHLLDVLDAPGHVGGDRRAAGDERYSRSSTHF